MRPPPFTYLNWIKARAPVARVNLSGSGMSTPPEDVVPLAGMPFSLDTLDVAGYAPLQERIARHTGVTPDRVLVGPGCTYALHLALRSVVDPGSDVVVETPTYELLPRVVEGLGARVVPWRRPAGRDFALDMGSLEACVTPATSAIALTAPHNPTGVPVDDATVTALAAFAARRRVPVVIDEVYGDFHRPDRQTARSLATVSDWFVTAGSLTKAHGLSNLRCGWVCGTAEVIRRARGWHDLLADRIPAWDAQAACLAFDRMPALLARNRAAWDAGFPVVADWARRTGNLRLINPGGGISVFVEMPRGTDTAALAERLYEQHGVLVVPGEMFAAPGWVRISFGVPRATLDEGLAHLAAAVAGQPAV